MEFTSIVYVVGLKADFDKLGIVLAKQTSMCLNPHLNFG